MCTFRNSKEQGVGSMEELLLVNRSDQILGTKEKRAGHLPPGKLHRAVSVWVVNSRGKVLVTKRSKKKMLWPGFWTNTVCSHPRLGESYGKAGERRLFEELGFSCRLKYLYKFIYEEKYKDIGWERELCGVMVGRYGGKVMPNKGEVEDYRWVGWKRLLSWSRHDKSKFTPWFFNEIERLKDNGVFKSYFK